MTLPPGGFPPGFEWDQVKNQENMRKHGLDFRDAIRIFERATLDIPDRRYPYGEERTVSIGELEGRRVLVVAHTDRDHVTRLISARPAEAFERARYGEYLRELPGKRPRRHGREMDFDF